MQLVLMSIDKLAEISSDPHDIAHCLVQGRCDNPLSNVAAQL